ncbi:MAG: hypothetical protein H6581_12115 [Bacteroidia bacterium]|nr:hypothetical protein [Bacteroidia bacterium]
MAEHEKIPKEVRETDNNVYANTIEGETIYIGDAESGRKGYFCKGCNQEMQAVKSKLPNRIDYFRHDPKGIKNFERKCTYRDETYRHKLAKNILGILKKVKLPKLLKYPPKGSDFGPRIIQDEKFIYAKEVRAEVEFFEQPDGSIAWRKEPAPEKHNLIKPDIVFFDGNDEPILFIELVATHKLTEEKKIKLRHLGIDTIQIIIPKTSPEEIQKNFSLTSNTKWVYSHEESEANYFQLPSGNPKDVPQIDKQQRGFFEEDFKCRKAEIENLIRAIGRCLESEPYRIAELGIRRELSRVSENRKRAEEQWRSLLERLRAEIDSKYRERRESVKERYRNLEGRYLGRKQAIEGQNGDLDSKIFEYEEFEKGGIEGIANRKRDVIEERNGVEKRIEEARNRRSSFQQKINEHAGARAAAIERIQSEQEEFEREIERTRLRKTNEIERIAEDRRTISGRFEALRGKLRERFETDRRELEERYEEQIRIGIEEAKNGLFRTNQDLTKRFNDIVRAGRILLNYEERYRALQRLSRAREILENKSYKNWEGF